MSVDLAAARTTAEATLNATCTITSDPEGRRDDTLDPTTLALVPPAPDTTTVYSGPCSIRSATQQSPVGEGGQDIYRTEYLILLPATAEPAVGQLVTVVASDDPHLAGRQLTIVDVTYSSRAVLRRCRALDRRAGPRT